MFSFLSCGRLFGRSTFLICLDFLLLFYSKVDYLEQDFHVLHQHSRWQSLSYITHSDDVATSCELLVNVEPYAFDFTNTIIRLNCICHIFNFLLFISWLQPRLIIDWTLANGFLMIFVLFLIKIVTNKLQLGSLFYWSYRFLHVNWISCCRLDV